MSAGGAHAVAYNGSEGLMDLGSLFPEASTRANAVNADGTVVVGWQDQNGPWKAAVWRKDSSGGYLPNTPILIDPTGSGTDENNLSGRETRMQRHLGRRQRDRRLWRFREQRRTLDLERGRWLREPGDPCPIWAPGMSRPSRPMAR